MGLVDRIICGDKKGLVEIQAGQSSLAIALEPFIGTMEVAIAPAFEGFLSLTATRLLSKSDLFPTPHYGHTLRDVPPCSYFLLAQDSAGYLACFCLSHSDMLVSLYGKDHQHIILQAISGESRQANACRDALVCCRGSDPYKTIEKALVLALELTGSIGRPSQEKLPPSFWLSCLGWQWQLPQHKSEGHQEIVEGVLSLKAAGSLPGFIILDEGWQDLSLNPNDKGGRLAMNSFDADPERFPKKLKGLIDDLHQIGVKHIGVWHGIMGYRGGIHPQLAKKYALPPDDDGRYFLGYDLGRTFNFFHDYYLYLREQGVSFVKIGDQSSTGTYCRSGMDPTQLYRNLQTTIQAAASLQFSGPHLNTDCLHNENLFYWTKSQVARAAASPNYDSAISVKQAIRDNLSNGLWLNYLMHSDYDAWRTAHEQKETLAILHALSRSISAINDSPGSHDKSLVQKIVLPGGLRLIPDRPLTLCQDSLFLDPLKEKKVYKAFTSKGNHGVLAIFNLYEKRRTLYGAISPDDVEGLEGDVFGLLSFHHGFLGAVSRTESLEISLKPNQGDVITFAPIKHGIGILGCYTYFLAPGPLIEINIEEDSMHVTSLVAAPILIYCERQILEVRRNGVAIPWGYDRRRKILSIDSRTRIQRGHSTYSIAFES